MKPLLSSLALLSLMATLGLAQSETTNAPAASGAAANTNAVLQLTSAEVKDHVGAKAVVTGKVAEVNKSASLVRLNFDKPFPDQTFTAIVFNRNTNQFSNLEQLKGKQVEITGKIALYHNHPEIQLQSSNQLKVVEAPVSGEKQ